MTDSIKDKILKIRLYSWDSESIHEFILRPNKYWGWDVYDGDRNIGNVDSYKGSLDRKAGRLRIPGKPRTLWSSRPPETTDEPHPRRVHGHISRAEAIRWLYNTTRITP